MTEYQLSSKDRERFGLPEWIADGREALDDLSFRTLTAWENELAPLTVAEVLQGWDEKSAVGIAGYMWLCLKAAGDDCPKWADFDIRTTAIKQKTVKPGPLAEASSQPSSETGESPTP